MASTAQSPVSFTGNLASKSTTSDLLRSSTNGVFGVPLRALGRAQLGAKKREYIVSAMIRKGKKREYPWARDPDPNVKGGVLRHLSNFKPLKEKPKSVILDFEKPLMDMQKKIVDVKKLANETGLDFSDHIISLENKYNKALKDLYTHLTPIQRLHIARHPHRPTFLDHVFNITEKFIELHGDRTGYDDPAIVTGLGSINGRTYMFIGHQKGRNTIENIQRNFGMPSPHGYRKALRMMHYADHHGFPVITFIDTPGAFADLQCEERGQGEVKAQNMKTMFGLKVPIVSIVTGEGGSGGALASACANKMLMLENAVFYVASPEARAAILWKNEKTSPKAAKKLRITARALFKLQICDGVLPEPLGGAHADPDWTSEQIKTAIVESMDELMKMDTETLLKHRAEKLWKIGRYPDPVHPESKEKDVLVVPELVGSQTGVPIDPKRKFRMKKDDHVVPIRKTWKMKLRDEVEKLEKQFLKASSSSAGAPRTGLEKMIEKLKRGIDNEYVKAAKAIGVGTNFLMVRKEIAKAGNASDIEQLKDEFDKQLPEAPNYSTIKYMLDMLKELSNTSKLPRKSTRKDVSRTEINKSSDLNDIIELLKAEVAEAGKTPEEDSKLKMLALEIEINQAIEDAVNLPELEEKDEKLVVETLLAC